MSDIDEDASIGLQNQTIQNPPRSRQSFNNADQKKIQLQHELLDSRRVSITKNLEEQQKLLEMVNQKYQEFESFSEKFSKVLDFNYLSMFREETELEKLSKKLMVKEEKIIRDNGQENEEEAYFQDGFNHNHQQFSSQKEARTFIFEQLIEKIFSAQFSDQSHTQATRDINFELLFINFTNHNLKRHFNAIFYLLRINQHIKNLKFLDRLAFITGERLILDQAMESLGNLTGGFDYSLFVDGNQTQLRLDRIYEKTTNQIIDFWSSLRSQEEETNKVQKIIDLGSRISRNVKEIKKITRQLEESYAARKDLSKYQTYAFFHLEMLNDPQTFSQMAAYLKTSSLFKSKRMFGVSKDDQDSSIQQQQSMLDEVGLCITNAWSGQHQPLRFIYGNKAFCLLFEVKENQLPGKSIENIMPSEVAKYHIQYVENLFRSKKRSSKIGQLRVQFAQTFEGNLFPVKLRVSMYYHPVYQYCFFVQVAKIKTIHMFDDETNRVSSQDLMLFTTDENLNVREFSKNVLEYTDLQQSQISQLLENQGDYLPLESFVKDIPQIMTKEFGSSILPENPNTALQNKMVQLRRYNKDKEIFDSSHTSSCVLTYFCQRLPHPSDVIRLNVFMILPLSRHPDYEGILSSNTKTNATFGRQMKSMMVTEMPSDDSQNMFEKQGNLLGQQFEFEKDSSHFVHSLSASATSSTASSNSTTTSNFVKNLLFMNNSPKVIKINLALILGMILAFIVISIYNVSIFSSKHSLISARFTAFAKISERNNLLRQALLSLKMLHSISQDQSTLDINITSGLRGASASTIFPKNVSRTMFYYQNMLENIAQAQENSEMFNQFIMDNKELYNFNIDFEGLQFLTDQGVAYTKTLSLSHAINLFGTYVENINITQLMIEKPSLNVSSYAIGRSNSTGNLRSLSPVTFLQENLFFIFENGLFKLHQLGQIENYKLQEVSKQQTEEGINILNISTYVSVAVVTLIGAIIFPLLSRVIDRQYSIIKFFNYIEVAQIDKMMTRFLAYQLRLLETLGSLNEKEQVRINSEINREVIGQAQKYLEQGSLELQPVESSHELPGVVPEVSSPSQADQEQNDEKEIKSSFKKGKTFLVNGKQKANSKSSFSKIFKDSRAQAKDANTDQESQKYSQKQKQRRKNHPKANHKENPKNENAEIEEEEIDQEVGRKSRKHHKRPKKDKSKERRKSFFFFGNAEKSDVEQQRSSEDQKKMQVLKQSIGIMTFKKRAKILSLVVALVLYLNASLLISYYLSQQVFLNDKESATQISRYYFREDCAYNLILFMREKIIQNKSLSYDIYESSTNFINEPAVDYYTSRCYQNEIGILSQRGQLPPYLKDAFSTLEKSESSELCSLIFAQPKDDFHQFDSSPRIAELSAINKSYLYDNMKDNCQGALGGVLTRGFANVMYYIIGYIQQLNLRMDAPVSNSKEYLKSLLNQSQGYNIADMSVYYLHDAFKFIQQEIMRVGQDYFAQMKFTFVLITCIYLGVTALLTLIICTFGYRKAKQEVLDIQNMLVLLPIEQLDIRQRQEIDKYLNS